MRHRIVPETRCLVVAYDRDSITVNRLECGQVPPTDLRVETVRCRCRCGPAVKTNRLWVFAGRVRELVLAWRMQKSAPEVYDRMTQ